MAGAGLKFVNVAAPFVRTAICSQSREAVENARTKIHLDGKQAVGDGHGGIRHRPGENDSRIVRRIVNPETEIIDSSCGLAAVIASGPDN